MGGRAEEGRRIQRSGVDILEDAGGVGYDDIHLGKFRPALFVYEEQR